MNVRSSAVRGVALFSALLAVPLEARGQASVQDTVVIPAVTADVVGQLFSMPVTPESTVMLATVDSAVPTPDVEAVFRGSIAVSVFTTGPGIDPDGYFLVVSGAEDDGFTVVEPIEMIDDVDLRFQPGRYRLSLAGLAEWCSVASFRTGPEGGRIATRADFIIECVSPPSMRVAVESPPGSRIESASVQLLGDTARTVAIGGSTTFEGLSRQGNDLRVSIPDLASDTSLVTVRVSAEPSNVPSLRVDGGALRPIGDATPLPATGGRPLDLALSIPDIPAIVDSVIDSVKGARRLIVGLAPAADGADGWVPESVVVQAPGFEARTISLTDSTTFDAPADTIILSVMVPRDGFGTPDGWYLSAGLGAIAVAATDPKSFITPTLGLSLVKFAGASRFALDAQFGYWRTGPSAADPVLPDDPRPPFRNRTIWTWALGASYFDDDWGGLGLSASWVEGRETASEEEKYINRSRGVAVGPRFRVGTPPRWPSLVLGLDVQYGETDELLQVEPEWGWSLTPVLSLSYVLR